MNVLVASAVLAAMIGSASAAGLQGGEPGFPGTAAPAATTWRQSCAAVQALVQRHNHAVLTYADYGYDPRNLVSALATLGSYGHDRVVKDQRYCLTGEGVLPIYVRAKDSAACFAGFTCTPISGEGSAKHSR